MKKRIRYICTALMTATLFFILGGVFCLASDKKGSSSCGKITAHQVVLSENTYHVTIELTDFDMQSCKVEVQMYDCEGNSLGTVSYKPTDKIEMEFGYSDDLDFAIITCLKKDGAAICEPLTLVFDRIYAADWQALATAIHRMDLLFTDKVTIEDSSSEYASGRLIVKTEEKLPDVSEFHVAMIIADDENHYFLQFEKTGDAKKCAEYLKNQVGIEYVDIDGVVTAA